MPLNKNEIKSFGTSKSLADGGIDFLNYTAKNEQFLDPLTDDRFEVDILDLGYINTMWSLDPHVENVVSYISRFVVKNTHNEHVCSLCKISCM